MTLTEHQISGLLAVVSVLVLMVVIVWVMAYPEGAYRLLQRFLTMCFDIAKSFLSVPYRTIDLGNDVIATIKKKLFRDNSGFLE